MKFDDVIRAAVRREFSLIIGWQDSGKCKYCPERTGRRGKAAIVYGRDIVTGLPVNTNTPTKMVDESLEGAFQYRLSIMKKGDFGENSAPTGSGVFIVTGFI